MIITNLMIGFPAMLLCLIVQVAVSFWSVRYYVRQSSRLRRRRNDFLQASVRSSSSCWS